jgi:hypothetical protein
MLFSMGVECVGLTPIERWREALKRARRRGEFLGVNEQRFPLDFATFVRYYAELKRKIPARYALPRPLTLGEEAGDRYPVQWLAEADAEKKAQRQTQEKISQSQHA